ncbi:MAG: sigma-54-dependent Fis family transcriptional regulator [Candidatus Hydrogenedens sp.]|nr:sigma-54-dependent Fis family transcriptional regulator [Candidatus Hydrogenedens sp.]
MSTQKHHILVVDDEQSMCEVLDIVLGNAGYSVQTSLSVEDAIELFQVQGVDLVLTDLYMDKDRDAGLRLLEYLKNQSPMTPTIMMTAHGSIDTAIEAMRLGAADYIQKPFKSNEEMLLRIERALQKRRLMQENEAFRAEQTRMGRLDTMVGASPAFIEVLSLIRRVAALPSTVAIQGESGVGKELVARALHTLSPRADKPFVAINCGGIPEMLLESELFGYKKGAFTGAVHDKEGLFVIANGGTIFLDEIGEMPLQLQVKLLRVLDDNCVTPVGSISSTTVDVRVLSATNRNLRAMVEEGHFRDDLYYRLNVIPIRIPPLRERKEDIPLLVKHLIKKHGESMNLPAKAVDQMVEEALLRYGWPGNIRELSNVLERALGLSDSESLQLEDLPEYIRNIPTSVEMPQVPAQIPVEGFQLEEEMARIEKAYLCRALEQTGYSQQETAQLLGLNVRALRYRLDKYELSTDPS